MRPQICLLVPLGEGPVDPGFGRPGGGGAVDPGWGVTPPTDPGYGRPAWGGHPDQGLPGHGHPDQGLPGGGHISTGPVWGGRPDNSLPGGGHPSTGPVWGGRPDNSLPVPPPEGSPPVEIWPPRPTTWPPQTGGGVEISNPIVLPAPPEGTVVLVWIAGVGYRYATIGAPQPK